MAAFFPPFLAVFLAPAFLTLLGAAFLVVFLVAGLLDATLAIEEVRVSWSLIVCRSYSQMVISCFHKCKHLSPIIVTR